MHKCNTQIFWSFEYTFIFKHLSAQANLQTPCIAAIVSNTKGWEIDNRWLFALPLNEIPWDILYPEKMKKKCRGRSIIDTSPQQWKKWMLMVS